MSHHVNSPVYTAVPEVRRSPMKNVSEMLPKAAIFVVLMNTAAHRSLDFGAAAGELGMLDSGAVMVRLEIDQPH